MIKNIFAQNEPFTIKGHWWLPESNRKVAGDMIYDEENLTLALYGALNDALAESPLIAMPEASEFPLVLGGSLDGEPITVLRSFYTQWAPASVPLPFQPGTRSNVRSSKLHCHLALFGIHLQSSADGFTKCCIEIPSLHIWLGDEPFDVRFVDSSFDNIQIHYARPKDERFEITARNSIVRLGRAVRPPSFPAGHAPAIEHSAYIEVESPQPRPIDWFVRYASDIVDLLSLFYGGNLQSQKQTLHKAGSDHGEAASLYYSRYRITAPPYGPHDFVIPFASVKSSFAEILEKWLTASEAEKRARRMLRSSELRPSEFIELRFLPLVHAAEVLTSETKHSIIVSRDEFRKAHRHMVDSVPDGLPSELVESISRSLGWANDRRLKGKLLNVLNDLQDETCRLFCLDRVKFIKGIVETRNHYTHYSSKQGDKLLDGMALHWAIRKTSLMLRVLLLLKTGVPEAILQSLFRSNHRLSKERTAWEKITEEGSPYNNSDDD